MEMGLGMAKKRAKSVKRRPVVRKDTDEHVHLIVAQDTDVVVERYPEDWLAMIIFWSLALIVFLQFFTRYVLNDSLSWTEEIARYGLMWVTFIGGIMVTRRGTHIAVELLSNLMKPGPARVGLLIFIDVVKFLFLGLLAYFSLTITERMDSQRMTVFDLPMSYVYAGVAIGCIGMFLRQAQNLWRNYKMRWRRPHDMHDQIIAD
jgi:TRAP-type C4-dicarboxylate transport system permease small subunit